MTRDLPHDVTNALAAAAIVDRVGPGRPRTRSPRRWRRSSTRRTASSRSASSAGLRWYNDSKATTPHAALTAIRGFDGIVLLAGGRNKGLDLASLATEHERVQSVSSRSARRRRSIAAAFAPWCPVVEVAVDAGQAVDCRGRCAEPGDAVLLSPACASFDWYPDGGYPARGDDFKRLVRELLRRHGAHDDELDRPP